MSNGLKKFKRKFQISALWKGALFGLAVGVALASVLVFVQKRAGNTPNPLWYILVGVVGATLAGGGLYLLLKPTDKKVAKRLDEGLGLRERVQTMVAFAGEKGDIVELQRQDTEEMLSQIPAKKIKTGKWWKHIFAPLLAAALCVTAILIPLKQTPPPIYVEAAWTMDSWQRTRLKNLIETVRNSQMEETPKGEVVEDLEGLLAALDTVDKVSTMKSLVVEVITNVNGIKKRVNTSDDIGEALKKSSLTVAQQLGRAVENISGITAEEELTNLQSAISYETATFGASVNAVSDGINLPLADLEIEPTDELYAALLALTASIREQKTAVEGGQDLTLTKTNIDGAFATAKEKTVAALLQQKYNADTSSTVVSELMKIFGLSTNDLPAGDRPSGGGNVGGGEEDERDDKPSDGGLGSGEVIYGSNDKIYYPDGDVYVSYGEVINEFFAKVEGQIKDEKTAEALAEFIRDYFAKLYDGSNNQE